MYSRLFRDPFLLTAGLSIVFHIGLGVWLGFGQVTLPETLPVHHGRVSINMKADPVRKKIVKMLDKVELKPIPPRPIETPPILTAMPKLPLPEVVEKPRQIDVRSEVLRLPSEPVRMIDRDMQPKLQAAPPLPNSQASTGVDVLPSLAFNPAPPYPADALAARFEGRVVLTVVVGANGRPRAVSLKTSSGYQSLDAAALRTVRDRWRFRPARRNGVAVEHKVFVPVRFFIRGR